MDTVPDAWFAELLTRLRASDFRTFTRLDVEQACATVGWTLEGGGRVSIPGTPSGGQIADDPISGGERCAHLSIVIATIEPEQFRRYLESTVATWGAPTWLCGLSDLDVGWVDGDALRTLALSGRGRVSLRIESLDADAHRRWRNWTTQYRYPALVDEDDRVPTDEHDIADTSADEYAVGYTWSAGSTRRGSEIWSVYTLGHLRGLLTDLLAGVHLAIRALGPGPEPLVLHFFDRDKTPDRYAQLELSPTEIRLRAFTTATTRPHLDRLGFVDCGDGSATRMWPTDQPRAAATVTVVFLHRVGLGSENLTMTESGNPLPLDHFSVDLQVDLAGEGSLAPSAVLESFERPLGVHSAPAEAADQGGEDE
ncbi:hypothetical protein [Nocardia alba]|uniref:Uncharacterized protein n=1 Tax=Nocardia alba TaxID=225051 RepID=A0A4R1FPA8_9NOCA|nr:hypothetical protein [Nocardia alba]TCJ96667.1 hypothetical protein DFR71_2698 [Nocardia alba]